MRESEKTGKIRAAELEIIRGECERHEMEACAAEIEVLRRAFPGVDPDEPWMGAVLDELMGVLVQECPEDAFVPGNETLKRVVFGEN